MLQCTPPWRPTWLVEAPLGDPSPPPSEVTCKHLPVCLVACLVALPIPSIRHSPLSSRRHSPPSLASPVLVRRDSLYPLRQEWLVPWHPASTSLPQQTWLEPWHKKNTKDNKNSRTLRGKKKQEKKHKKKTQQNIIIKQIPFFLLGLNNFLWHEFNEEHSPPTHPESYMLFGYTTLHRRILLFSLQIKSYSGDVGLEISFSK